MAFQFKDRDIVWDCAERFAHVHVGDVSLPSLVHQCCNPMIEGHKQALHSYCLSCVDKFTYLQSEVLKVKMGDLCL